MAPFLFTLVINRDDIRMIDGGEDGCFPVEPFQEFAVTLGFGKDLDRNYLAGGGVVRTVHGALTALADHFK